MKKNKKILKRKEKGITLIALVITIIVLLILAGVSIAMLTGDNGILTQAQNAKNKTEGAEEEEKVKLAVTAAKMYDTGTIEENTLKDELVKYFKSESNFSIESAKNNETFLITIIESGRSYYIDENGNIDVIGNNQYTISNLDELEVFRDKVNSGDTFEGKSVILLDDIELQENWEPIGQIRRRCRSKLGRYR